MFFSLFLGLFLLILNVALHSPVPVLHVLCNCEIRCKNVHPVFLLNHELKIDWSVARVFPFLFKILPSILGIDSISLCAASRQILL